ncbi:MAG: SIS domain-containing protein [Chloroflexota bacterium]|nr:SIS domain-containing protein [Chloroflexota bacterium]
MPNRSPMHQQINTLPELIRAIVKPFDASARRAFDFATCTSVKRIYLVGCGDSHHAPVGAELAFHQLTGLPTQAMSSLPFSRYTAGFLPDTGPGANLVICVSVSGEVSRTIEAMDLARKAGATAVALTGNPGGPLGAVADRVFETAVPPLPDELAGMVVPGIRSYLASQIALLLAALRIAEVRGSLATAAADAEREAIAALADAVEETIQACEPVVDDLVERWRGARLFEFVGAGPLYGVAMFSAAKVLEASGDAALAQETEEWSHLQYFAEDADTPLILHSADQFDADRMAEVARAAQSISRPIALVATEDATEIRQYVDTLLPIPRRIPERYASVVYSIPGELFAAARAAALGAPYFRDFEGGRKVPWANGASQIYSSNRITAPNR